MKLTVLVDNNTFTDKHLLGEPGLCYWIEADNKHILFDLGFSDTYLKNAKKLDINLSKTDYIVLSHGHNDHTQGLKFFPHPSKRIRLISHPDCLLPKQITDDYYIGSPVLKKEAEEKYNYVQSKEPCFITPNICFLGEIESNYDFEARKPIGFIKKNNKKEKDLLFDDTALAIKTKKGIVIVTGCSHSGICNIINQAKRIFKNIPIYSVIGGFHLRGEFKDRLEKTVKFLRREVAGCIYPAHCSDFQAKCFLARHLKTETVFVSKKVKFG